ncbi:MAG: helix-turn-helix domain-containing protein [Planctomycetota bacterium]
MVSKLIGVRVPPALLELINADSANGGTTDQAVILERLAASYGIEIDSPRRGAATVIDAGKVRKLAAKGKTAAEIAEKLGASKTRVYEILATPDTEGQE